MSVIVPISDKFEIICNIQGIEIMGLYIPWNGNFNNKVF
jgi:hypothetical protein